MHRVHDVLSSAGQAFSIAADVAAATIAVSGGRLMAGFVAAIIVVVREESDRTVRHANRLRLPYS